MKRLVLHPRPLAAALLALAALSILMAACGSDEPARVEGLARVKIGELVVNAEVPRRDEFHIGLAGREALPDDRGMLFVFDDAGRRAFWMKGMLISIDIIWISSGGRVVDIKTADPEPGVPDVELTRHYPSVPAQYTLEVRAGLAAEKGVKVGDEAEIELP